MGKMSWGSPYTKQTIESAKRPKKPQQTANLRAVYHTLTERGIETPAPDNGQWAYQRPADANRAYVAPPPLRTYQIVNHDGVRTVEAIEPPETTAQQNQITQNDILERRMHVRPWWRVIADDEETDLDQWVDCMVEILTESNYTTVTAYLFGTNNDAYFIECCNIYDLTVHQMIELVEDSVNLYIEDRNREQVEIERQDNEEDYEPDEDDEPVF